MAKSLINEILENMLDGASTSDQESDVKTDFRPALKQVRDSSIELHRSSLAVAVSSGNSKKMIGRVLTHNKLNNKDPDEVTSLYIHNEDGI